MRTAGHAIVRQRPRAAKGFCFLTLEDETGFLQCVVYPQIYERCYDALIQPALVLRGLVLAREAGVEVDEQRLARAAGFLLDMVSKLNLAERREKDGVDDVALFRLEQLYPFPRRRLRELLDQYAGAQEIVWCQEDPRNQGAWYQIQHHLRALKHSDQSLGYAGRPPSASPACGYPHLHQAQQQALINTALADKPVDDPGERLDDTDTH